MFTLKRLITKPEEYDVETRLDVVDYKNIIYQYSYKKTLFCNGDRVQAFLSIYKQSHNLIYYNPTTVSSVVDTVVNKEIETNQRVKAEGHNVVINTIAF